MGRRIVVTLCGGSSGNHVLAADLGRRDELEVRVVTRRPEAWSTRIACEEISVPSDALPLLWPTRSERYVGTIDALHSWETVDRACAGADIVLLVGPVHAHRAMLERLVPVLARSEPTILGSAFAQGGLDWIFRDLCREHGVDEHRHTLFGLKRFPFLCTATRYGEAARLMGRFPRIVTALRGGSPRMHARAHSHLRAIFRKPVVEVPSLLACTLNLSNQVLHPAISSAILQARGFVPGQTTFAEPIRLYGSCDRPGAANMCALANEIRDLALALEELTGQSLARHLGADPGVRLYLLARQLLGRHLEGHRAYETMRDHLVASSIRHNRRLEQAQFPLVPAPSGEGLVPDFASRFWLDDIPHGLCVLLGLAALTGVPMPRTRALVLEHQAYMGKQYLRDGLGDPLDPFGPDRDETNAPQRYGVHDRDALRAWLGEGSP